MQNRLNDVAKNCLKYLEVEEWKLPTESLDSTPCKFRTGTPRFRQRLFFCGHEASSIEFEQNLTITNHYSQGAFWILLNSVILVWTPWQVLGESPLPDTERMELQLVILPLRQEKSPALIHAAQLGELACHNFATTCHTKPKLIWNCVNACCKFAALVALITKIACTQALTVNAVQPHVRLVKVI